MYLYYCSLSHNEGDRHGQAQQYQTVASVCNPVRRGFRYPSRILRRSRPAGQEVPALGCHAGDLCISISVAREQPKEKGGHGGRVTAKHRGTKATWTSTDVWRASRCKDRILYLVTSVFSPQAKNKSDDEHYTINERINNATMLMTLIIGLTAGPAVSLYGSPTVSPVTAAW